MARPTVLPVEEKVRVVLAVLAGEMTVAAAARQAKVSGVGGATPTALSPPPARAGLAAGSGKPSTREQQLEAEVADLTTALGEAAVELRVWKKSAEGRLGPSRTSR